MAVTLMVKKGETKSLPRGGVYTVGVGWDAKGGVGDSPDLDVWVIRRNAGQGEPICWANSDWHRPDLGANSEGNPYIATPELDVIHQGDDRTGATSDGGYDEIVKLDLTKAPAGVDQYDVFVTYYEDPDNAAGLTLGMAENIKCGVMDETSGNELKIELGNDHAFDVTAHVASIKKDASGNWGMEHVAAGFSDSMFTVMGQFGVVTS